MAAAFCRQHRRSEQSLRSRFEARHLAAFRSGETVTELYQKYRVVIVTAESDFASPLSPQGKVYAAVEGFRSTEQN